MRFPKSSYLSFLSSRRPAAGFRRLLTAVCLASVFTLSAAGAKAPPATPGSVTVTRADGTLTASWPAVEGATSYHVTYSSDGGGSWSLAALNHPDNSITIGVDNANSYLVGVRARNEHGDSGWRNSPSAGPYTPPNDDTEAPAPDPEPEPEPAPAPSVTLSLNPSSLSEDAGSTSVTVTATASSAVAANTPLTVTIGGGTATSGTDYTASVTELALEIPAGGTTGTGAFKLTPVYDTDIEGKETIPVSGSGSGLSVSGTSLTLTDSEEVSAQWWHGARLSVSPGSVSENGGKQLVTVTAEVSEWGTSTTDLSYEVTVGKGGDSAVSGTDYKAVSKFNVTVKANRRSGSNSFNLEPIGDTAWEGDETITIHAEGTGGAQSTSLTLTDEGDRPYSGPQVTLSANPSKLSEADGATTVTVTATSTAHSTARTVAVSVGGSGTATSGTDYAAVSDFTITLAANATTATGTFTLTPTQDKLAEGDETIAVAGNVEGVSAKLTGTTLTLTDDDKAPAITLSVSPVVVTENGGAKTVTVTATSAAAAARARTVLVAVGNRRKDTATPGTDYTVVPAFNITLAANATTATGTFTLTPTNDTSVEDTESISIDGTPESGGANFTVGGAAIALTDDDAQPAVTLTATPASVDEAALATSVTVKATAASAVAWARTVTVSVGKTGSAASGTDYAAVSNFDVTIAANATSGTGTFTLNPIQDTTNEGNETIGVAGASLNTTVTGTTVTLADDDINPAVTLSVSPASVSESASATTVTVTATGASAMTSARTVAVKVGGGTATSGTDYAAVSDFNITIAANATSGTGTFTLTPTNDTTVEGGETIGVAGTSTSTTVTGTTVGITDDDTYPAVTLSVSTSSVAESASATSVTVTATAASAISSARTVTVSVGQTGTAAPGSDYAAVTDFDITIAANATSGTGTFTLTPTQDTAVEYNETIGVNGSSPNTTMTNATITLTDDDKDAVTLSLNRKTLGEEASGTSVTVTATAATPIAVARTVTVSVGGSGTATSGTDYAAVSDFDITIAANATSGTGSFTLTPTQDTASEGNETIGIAGTNSLATVTGTTLTLVDDDQPTISLSAGTAAFSESWSGTINVTATRSGSTTSAVDVTIIVGRDTDSATEGVDYTEVADYTITIPAGQTSASKGFSVSGKRDFVADNNERFSIGGLATGYKVNDVSNGVGIFEWYATIGLTTDVSSVSEHDGATTVTVTAHIHPTVYGNVYVTVSVGGGTATSGTDYAAVSNFTITIPNKASSATGTFTLTPTQDALLESDETININGSGSHWNFYAGQGTSMTLTDAQTVALSATPSSVSEGAPPTQVAVTATATGTVSTPRTLTVKVGDTGTATSGTDYAAVSDFDITIPANKTGATNTFTLTPTKDSAGEGDETIGVSGSSTGAYVYPTTLNLTDTNPAVTLSASPSSISEGGSATSVTVTATASAALATARTVTVSVGGSGTATSGTDYAAVSDFTITIAANETSGTGTFTLTPTDDTALEGDETIHVTGTSAEAATISRTTLTLTDDDLPTIALTTVPSYVDVAEDGSRESVTVRATAAAAMKAETTVTLAIGAGGDSATKTTDYTVSNVRTITIPKDQSTAEASFELTPVEDTLVEGNEAVSVSGSSSGGHTVTGTSVTLTDDDRYRITLSASPSSVGEGASATSVTVTATANSAVSSARTVKVKVGGSGTATSGTDYAAVSDFDITIAANATSGTGTFTLTPTQDTSVEGSETIGVAGTSALSRVSGTTVTLTDDDSYPAITLSANPSSVSEGASGTSVTVTAAAASAITSARTVTVSVGGSGTATAGTDYATVADFDITIAADATSGTGTFTLTPTQDTAVEGSETVGVAGTSASSTVTPTTVTLSDDDTHAITLSASPSSVSESKASETITVTATINVARSSATAVTVSVGESGDEATSGTDYEAVSDFTVTIAANKTSGTGTFTFKPKTDSAYEGFESVTISGTTSQSGGGANANSANTSIPVTATSLSIHDSSNYPALTLSAAPSSVGEGASATSVTVTATAASAIGSSREVTVSVGGSGTAASGTDYAAVSDFIIKIAADSTSGTGTFTLTPTDDVAVEGSETIGVAGSSLSTTVTATTVTLTDDDKATLTINDTTAAEGSDLTFTVTLDTAVVGGLTVTPGYTNGTASSSDYTANTTGISFSGNANETKTFTVSTTQDDVVEANETFTVGLSVSGTTLGSRITSTDTGTGTISSSENNHVDTATLTINDVSASEGDSLTFTVTLSEAVQGGLTVTPGSFTDGTAKSTGSNKDYKKEANPASLTFTGTKGESHSFKVPSTEDAVLEANETFTVGMSVSGTNLGDRITSTDTGTGTINNDDSAAVTIADANADEGDDMTFTVTLSEAVQGGLTVTPDFTDVSAVEGTDYDENTTALTFTGTKGETQTFTVSTTEDEVVEEAETFTVGLTASDAPTGTSVTDTDTGTGTINNDDGAVVTVNDAKADEGDAITFTVTLGAAIQGGLTVTPDFTDVTAAEGTDYDENTTALTFTGTKGETKTFTVATTEDAVLEANETFTVGLTASGAPTGTTVTDTDTGTGTIDNDDSAAVTVNDAKADEGDDITFTVTLSEAVQGGLTVTPDFTDVTAAEGTDYDENTAALTFTGTKGETQTFTVSTTEDAVVEAAETFTVGLTASDAPTGTSVTDTDEGTGTINNDDGAVVTVNDASASEGNEITFTVSLGAAVQGGLTVTPGSYAKTGTYPAESGDYTKNTAPLTFTGTKGETQSFTVSTTEDAVVEYPETFTVGLSVSNAPSGVTATDTGTGTINNDDGAVVTVNDANADEGDGITFTVTLSEAVQGGLTVTPGSYAKTGTYPAESGDYTKNTAPLSFTGTKGETQSFAVSTTEDAVVEYPETFTVGLSVSKAPNGITSTDTGTGTIKNDDTATVSVSDGSATESNAITFTVTLSAAVQGGLTVTPGYTNGTAASSDYTANTTALSFSGTKGETESFSVSTTEDAVLEYDETFTVTLSVSNAPPGVSPAGAGGASANGFAFASMGASASGGGTGTILNDDDASLSVSSVSSFEGGVMSFTVTLDKVVQGGLTATPVYTNVTASDDDYNGGGALTFSGAAGEQQSLAVSAVDDEVVESDETFTVGLTVSDAPAGVSTGAGTGTIHDDDELPAVSLSGPAGIQNGPFAVSIDFTKTVGGFEASDLTVGNGTASLSGSGASYTASITPSSSGTVTVDVAAGVAQDGHGNPNSASNQYVVEADLDRPSVRLSGPADTQGGPFAVSVTFSESVSGFEASDVRVGNGSASLSGSDSSYTAMITPSSSGTVTVDVASAVAHDVAGNDNTAAAQYAVVADLVSPTVTLSGPAGPVAGSFTVSIEFSEGVAGFEASDLTVSNGAASDFSGSGSSYSAKITPSSSGRLTVDVAAGAAYDAGGRGNSAAVQYAVEVDLDRPSVRLSGPADIQRGSFTVSIEFSEAVQGFETSEVTVSNGTARLSGSGSSYDAVIAPSSSGPVTVDVAAGVAQDAAGHDNTAADRYRVETDLVAPSVRLSGPADVQGGSFTVSIEFSEAVQGFEASEVTVSNGTARLSGSGSSYDAVIAPTASGQVTVDVAAGVVHDVAGNGNTAADRYRVEADLVVPSVSLSGPADVQGGSFTVAIEFSEEVDGFEVSDVTVGNGTASLSGSGAIYSAVIAPSSSGPVAVDVAAGVAFDVAGNGNTAADRYTVAADLAAPSVSLSGPGDTQGGPFTVSIEFSEAVQGFEASDVTVSNGTVSLSGSGASYSAVVTPSSSGPVTVDVAAGVAQDAAGNGNSAAAQYAVTADLAAPSVRLSGPAGPVAGAFTVAIAFSEGVRGFEASDVTVGNGTASLSGSGLSYSAVVTPSSSGTVTVDVAAGAAADARGNLNTAAVQYSVEADLVAPTVTLSGPADTQGGPFTVAIEFSEAVEGFEVSDVTVGNGSASLSGSGTSYSAVVTPSSSGTVTVDVAAGAAHDAAGNGNSAAAQYAVTADLVAPSVTLSGPAGPVTEAFTVTITFSEAVSGFEASEVTVGNGTASLSGTGTSYTAVVTPSSSGTVTVDVAAGVAVDAQGHLNSAAAQYTVEADLDRAPAFAAAGVRRSVAENSPAGAAIGAPVTAVAAGDTLTYSLSGADAASFAIDAGSGQLRTRAPLDYETRTTYAVTVEATDGNGGRAVQAVTIAVTDVDEPPAAPAAPQVSAASTTSLKVEWTAPANAGRPAISDYDLQYRKQNGTAWTAHAFTGAGTETAIAALQSGATYEVQVRAVNDEGAGPWSAPGSGAPAAAANRAPRFVESGLAYAQPSGADFGEEVAAAVRRSVAENSPAGAAIGAPVTAVDADGDTLTYSLSGADAASFALDADSGQLRTRAALDYETRTTYAVTVEARDGRGGRAVQAVAIAVTDVDEAPAAADDAATVAEGGAVTLDVLANDTDPEGAALRVELVAAAAHGAVTIDAGNVTYAHDGSETTADGFSYRVHDGSAYSAAAAVTITVTAVNDAPAADAGADRQAAEGETVYLRGSGTDPEGEALTYAWTQVSGASVEFSAAASASVQFIAPAQLTADAVLVFSLVVTDASGAVSAPDEVTVTVTAVNDAPVADAGADREAAEGETVYLKGSGTDPEGEALTFAWTQVSGAAVELSGAASDSLGFTAPAMLSEDAVLVFALVVTDASGAVSAPDEVTVTVKAAPNQAPVFAAPDYTFGLVEHVDAGADPLNVGDVLAIDPEDEGVAYALAAGDSSRFAVDAVSGRIAYKGPGEDARNTDSYLLTVSAADPRGASSTVQVSILVGVARVAKKDMLSAEQMEIRRAQRAEAMELSLAALGRTLAASTVDVVGRRVESSAAAEGSYAELAGRRLSGASGGGPPAALSLEAAMAGQEGFSGEAASEQEMLTGSSFQWTLKRPGQGVWTLWGRGAFNGFAGQPRGRDFTMQDGQLSQGYMGLDYLRSGETLAGVALSHGASELYYESGSVGRGDVLARLTGFYPYARWAPRAGLDLWGLVGVGRGEARLVYGGRTDLSTGLGLRLAAVGARNLLTTYRGVRVAAKADVFAVRLQPEESEELARVRADARRLRLLLEGTTNWTLTPQSRLTPSLEVGGRWDGGAAERGLGAEVGGGLHYAHQENGLDVEVRGRRLLAHGESAFKDWGASVVLRLAPGNRRGLGLELEPAWGQGARQQSAQNMWRDEQAAPALESDRSASRRPDRTDLRLSYGLEHPAGTLTPFGELALGREAGSLRLGARLAGSESAEKGRRWLEVFGERRAPAGGATERRVGIQGNLTY